MPNRIIRESCRTSKTLNRLSAEGERLFWRLITLADDHGRFEAETGVVRGMCFPLREDLTLHTVERWLQELVGGVDPCLQLYHVNGKRYGRFFMWEKHQRIRNTRSKFPDPPPLAASCGESRQVAASRGKLQQLETTSNDTFRVAPVVGSSSRESRVVLSPSSPQAAMEPASPPNTLKHHFDQLWAAYPRKVGKQAAWRIWLRLRPNAAMLSTMLSTIERVKQTEQWQEQGGRFIPHPSTWLNQGRWDDEPVTTPQSEAERRKQEILHGR